MLAVVVGMSCWTVLVMSGQSHLLRERVFIVGGGWGLGDGHVEGDELVVADAGGVAAFPSSEEVGDRWADSSDVNGG